MNISYRSKKRKSQLSIEPIYKKSPRNSMADYFDNYRDSIIQDDHPLRKPPKRIRKNGKKIIKRQKIEDVFKSIIKSINMQSHRTLPNIYKNKQYMPISILNTLYRQNIRNYNPYIATLQQLQQQKLLNPFQKQRISNLCHIGIAKTFIKGKKYSLQPKYMRVNVLIRTYMRDKMCEQVKYKQQTYDNVFFVPSTELALSFNPNHVPKGIDEFMSTQFFCKIICEVNNIITTEYVKYKTSYSSHISESLVDKFILAILLIISIVFCLNKSIFLLPIIFGLGIFYILYLIFDCKQRLKRLVESKSVIATILQRINMLFEKIKTDMVEWKVGKDFYWLEIHYIKKKKRIFIIE